MLIALSAFGFVPAIYGQTRRAPATVKTPPASDVIMFGDKQIRVPVPAGYTAISGTFKKATQRIRDGNGPLTELLEAYVPLTFVPELRKSEDITIGSYALVEVGNDDREKDFSQADYDAQVAVVKDNFNEFIDPNGPVMKALAEEVDKKLAARTGIETDAKFTGSRSLGFFEKSDKVFSGMLYTEADVRGHPLTTLMTVSMLYVNHRMVLTYFFKLFPAGKDFASLPELAKKWNAAILAANK